MLTYNIQNKSYIIKIIVFMTVKLASECSNFKSQVHNSGKENHPSFLRDNPSWLNIMSPFSPFDNV